ncbi:copper resistance CopC family protein [Actinoplanes sp. NPDC051861]|uniref:copper resistance CopC family protein n=1 Tax=Actinoplanes sp. NPDC051861 TaxID=3155170 RepID=UPI00343B6A87
MFSRAPRRPARRAAALPALFALALGVLAGIAPGSPAWAHNALVDASPAKKATLTEAPTEITLKFLQKLDPERTSITVSDSAKQKVPASEPVVDGPTGSVEVEGVLANGVYTVAYSVASTDGHTVKGSYQFTVAAPATSAPAATSTPAATTPAAEAAPVEPASDKTSYVGIVVAVVVVLAGIAGFLFVRRRKA